MLCGTIRSPPRSRGPMARRTAARPASCHVVHARRGEVREVPFHIFSSNKINTASRGVFGFTESYEFPPFSVHLSCLFVGFYPFILGVAIFAPFFLSGFPPQNRLGEKELARTDPLSRQLVQVRYAFVVHKQIHQHYWPALANFVSFRSIGEAWVTIVVKCDMQVSTSGKRIKFSPYLHPSDFRSPHMC